MPDSVPNYLTTNPDGTVGADFSGHISAAGIDILEAGDPLAPPADRRVAWHYGSLAGAVIAEVLGAESGIAGIPGAPDSAILQGRARTATRQSVGSIRALDDTGVVQAFLAVLRQQPPAVSQVIAQADDLGITRRLIISSDGQSNFIQTPGGLADRIAIDWGISQPVWPGGSPSTGSLVVGHRLGRTPKVVVGTSYNVWANRFIAVNIPTMNAVNFSLDVRTVDGTSPALGIACQVAWLALG